ARGRRLCRLQPGAVIVPPNSDLGLVGIDRSLAPMHVPVDRQAFFLPPPDGTFVAFQVGGNVFPGIQAFAHRGSPAPGSDWGLSTPMSPLAPFSFNLNEAAGR